MRVRSEIDFWLKILIWAVVLILTVIVFSTPLDRPDVGAILGLALIVFLLWICYGTYYELRDEYLYCRSGPFFERIYYDKVKSIKLAENFWSSMALSSKRIEIKQHNKSFIMGTTYISPMNRENFFYELKKRCKNLNLINKED